MGVLAKAQAVEKAGKVAMSSCSRCADFLVGKRPIIDEASEIRNETWAALLAVQPRIQAATRQATEVLGVASSSKQKISAKMAAKKRADKNKATFAKYDKDGDGYLSKEEIIAYTKGEYDFALPEGNAERICRQVVKGDNPGVAPNTFQLLKCAVGIAREEERCKDKRKIRLAREEKANKEKEARVALIEKKKEDLKEPMQQLSNEIEEVASLVSNAEKEAQDLTTQAGLLSVDDLKLQAQKTAAAIVPARSAVIEKEDKIKQMIADIAEFPELAATMQTDLAA